MLRRLQSYEFIAATVLIISLVGSLLTSSLVSAVSAYDNIIQTVNSAVVKKDSTTIDLSTSWVSILADCTNNWYEDSVYPISCSQFNTKLQTAFTNGTGWALSVDDVKSSYSLGGVSTFAPGDKYVNIGISTSSNNFSEFSGVNADAQLSMKGSGFTDTCTASIYVQTNYNSRNGSNPQPTKPQVISAYCGASSSIAKSHAEPLYDRYVYTLNSPINYPTGYEGASAPGSSDFDNDGLIAARETAQGTSDSNKDTDSDGLDDNIESQWYPNRQSIFCGTDCAYPNPIQKDLYVEIDWMKDGSRVMKPNATQLAKVEEAFTDQNIVTHFDTGQYGGGNELPTYTQDLSFYRTSTATDFYDYKYGNPSIAANFDTDRYKIWHYVIAGYRYTQVSNSSGASYIGDDDSFISLGLLEDNQSSNVDNAVAGTILHELGHSLCLSKAQDYSGQPTSCVYAGVHAKDDPIYSSYHSVMNYDYQFSSLIDLSDGTSTPEDHDDWGAVAEGMGDFVNSDAEGEDPDNQNFSPNSRTYPSSTVRRITP